MKEIKPKTPPWTAKSADGSVLRFWGTEKEAIKFFKEIENKDSRVKITGIFIDDNYKIREYEEDEINRG